jgi:hypothetical protein
MSQRWGWLIDLLSVLVVQSGDLGFQHSALGWALGKQSVKLKTKCSWAWWHTPVLALRDLRIIEFKASLGFVARLRK